MKYTNSKESFSLVEVLIAVMLIVTVIGAVLQMQNTNLHYLEKYKDDDLESSYINMALSLDFKGSKYLDDLIEFKDDEIRKKLKEAKVTISKESIDPIELPDNDFLTEINIEKTTVEIQNGISRSFFTFKLP
jgi:hypothetical protein